MQLDPYSTEARYTLDILAARLARLHPRSVRIATSSVGLAESAARRLACLGAQLHVDDKDIQQALATSLALETSLANPGNPVADVVLFPFSLEEGSKPANERFLFAACHNGLSYKSVIAPRTLRVRAAREMAKLARDYRIRPIAGLYSPRFIVKWAAAKAMERIDSAWYFRLEELAMRDLIDFGPSWRLSYIVTFAGKKRTAE